MADVISKEDLLLIPNERYILRRIIELRQTKPGSWRQLAVQLGADSSQLRRWHKEGLAIIAKAKDPAP